MTMRPDELHIFSFHPSGAGMRENCVMKTHNDVYYRNFSKFMLDTDGIKCKPDEYSYDQWSASSQTIHSVPLKTLKHTLKIHDKPVSGNKKDLVLRLEQYFLQIKMVIRIQKTFRGFLVRESEKLRGYEDATHCNNSTDFYTLESIAEIPHELLFSYRDANGFAYGFNILSLVSMFKRNRKLVNPYNREDIPFFVLQRLFSVYKKSRILYPSLILAGV